MVKTTTTKTTITANERLQLVGLFALAKRHNRLLKELQHAAEEIDSLGHTGDAIYCDTDVDELLRRLSIRIEEPPSSDAVDPSATSTGTPSTRDVNSSSHSAVPDPQESR